MANVESGCGGAQGRICPRTRVRRNSQAGISAPCWRLPLRMTHPDEQRRCRYSPVTGTLLVLLGAATILAVIMTVTLLATWGLRRHRKQRTPARVQVQKLHDAAQEYLSLFGRCPTLDDLVREDLIKRNQGRDQFGKEYRIRCTLEAVEARSAGRDNRFDTPDDIVFAGPRTGKDDDAEGAGFRVPP